MKLDSSWNTIGHNCLNWSSIRVFYTRSTRVCNGWSTGTSKQLSNNKHLSLNRYSQSTKSLNSSKLETSSFHMDITNLLTSNSQSHYLQPRGLSHQRSWTCLDRWSHSRNLSLLPTTILCRDCPTHFPLNNVILSQEPRHGQPLLA
jgi:hypothetical protein